MESVYISLPTGQAVQDFTRRLSGLEGDFELVSDGFILDARSLMGIFSLDLTKPLRLDIHQDAPAARAVLADFLTTAPEHTERTPPYGEEARHG